MELNYRKAVQDDAELLIEMYNAAFHADYIRYGECPAYGKRKRWNYPLPDFPNTLF